VGLKVVGEMRMATRPRGASGNSCSPSRHRIHLQLAILPFTRLYLTGVNSDPLRSDVLDVDWKRILTGKQPLSSVIDFSRIETSTQINAAKVDVCFESVL